MAAFALELLIAIGRIMPEWIILVYVVIIALTMATGTAPGWLLAGARTMQAIVVEVSDDTEPAF
jgi:hypothetical protein